MPWQPNKLGKLEIFPAINRIGIQFRHQIPVGSYQIFILDENKNEVKKIMTVG